MRHAHAQQRAPTWTNDVARTTGGNDDLARHQQDEWFFNDAFKGKRNAREHHHHQSIIDAGYELNQGFR